MDPYEGRVVLNYRIARKLGEGGFGAVYRAIHEELGRQVAIKILRRQHAGADGVVERFLREARVICSIGHPDIVGVENAGRLDSGEPFFLMELVEGRSLSALVQQDGPLPLRRIARVFAPLARALGAAHDRSIVHRDLKPQNVMVRERDGAIEGIRLLDFGIAKLLHAADTASETGGMMGTPHYMAPEQARDAKNVDARADIYSFAATLYFAATGRHPFEAGSVPALLLAVQSAPPPLLSQTLPDAPPALTSVLTACMAKHPDDRPATIEEAWRAIEAALATAGAEVPATITSAESALTGPTVPRSPIAPRAVRPEDAPGGTLTEAPRRRVELESLEAAASSGPSSELRSRRRGRWWLPVAALLLLGGAATAVVIATRDRAGGRASEGERAGGVAPGPDDAELDGLPRPPAPPTTTELPPSTATPPPTTEGSSGSPDSPPAPPGVAPPEPAPPGVAPPVPAPSDPADDAPPLPPPPDGRRDRRARSRAVDAGAPALPGPGDPYAEVDAPPRPVCTRASFAAVYNAATPTSDEVRSALRRLAMCRDTGAIDAAEHARLQAALVAKL